MASFAFDKTYSVGVVIQVGKNATVRDILSLNEASLIADTPNFVLHNIHFLPIVGFKHYDPGGAGNHLRMRKER